MRTLKQELAGICKKYISDHREPSERTLFGNFLTPHTNHSTARAIIQYTLEMPVTQPNSPKSELAAWEQVIIILRGKNGLSASTRHQIIVAGQSFSSELFNAILSCFEKRLTAVYKTKKNWCSNTVEIERNYPEAKSPGKGLGTLLGNMTAEITTLQKVLAGTGNKRDVNIELQAVGQCQLL